MDKLKERVSYFEIWRGVGMVAVVGIHSMSEVDNLELAASANVDTILLILRQMLNFAVPLFVAFSGYFISATAESDVWGYLRKRLCRIGVPYLLWSVAAIFIFKYDKITDVRLWGHDLLLGQAIGVYYFLVLLFQLVVLTPILLKLSTRQLLSLGFALSFLSVVSLQWIRFFDVDIVFSRFPYFIIPFTVWIWFYTLGMAARRHHGLLSSFLQENIKYVLICVIGTFMLSVASAFYYKYLGNTALSMTQVKMSSFTYSSCMLLLIFSGKFSFEKIGSRLFQFIGRNSFGVYLLHMWIMMPVVFYFDGSLKGLAVALLWLFSLAVAVLVCFIIRSCITSKRILNALGV